MNGHEKWIELAEIYAAGALDGRELQEFSAHYPDCEFCREQIREIEDALTALPKSLQLVPAPARVKQRLMEEIAPAGAGVSMSWAPVLVMSCLVVALGVAFMQTRQKMMDYKKIADQVQAPQAKVVAMGPMEPSPKASGKMIWNESKSEGMFMVSGMAPLPEGMVYELWAIAGSTPVPAGTFTVDATGSAKMELKGLPGGMKVEKFAVTIEPAGGLPKPSGAMHLIGTV